MGMSRRGRIYRQYRDMLFGPKSHELFVFCFFLAVSFAFWLLQALNETFEREIQVNLRIANVPSDAVIIDSLPSTVNVVLRDRGLALARYGFSGFFWNRSVELDFQKYAAGKDEAEVCIPVADMQRMLGKIFLASTKVQSFRPDTISFSYNHGLSRVLPVRLAGTFKASPQNYVQNIQKKPDSVRVYAPAAILDTMQAVYTEAFLMEGMNKSENFQIGLRRQKLFKYEPGQVEVRVNVGYYTEKTVKVPIIGLNFPADRKLRTFPAQASITFKVESRRFRQITSEDFVLATTYEELLDNTSDSKLILRLKTIPQGASNVRITPREVDYLIEQTAEE